MARNSSSQGLDPQEEAELWRLCRQGDEEAREALIVAYRPLVFWLARRFSLDEGTAKDLLQEGMLALIKAVDAYDVSRGNKFTTYAFYRIRGHMINFLERSEKRAPYPVDMEEEIAQPGECVAVEWRLLLEEAMGALTLKERDIIQALVVEGKKSWRCGERYRDRHQSRISHTPQGAGQTEDSFGVARATGRAKAGIKQEEHIIGKRGGGNHGRALKADRTVDRAVHSCLACRQARGGYGRARVR